MKKFELIYESSPKGDSISEVWYTMMDKKMVHGSMTTDYKTAERLFELCVKNNGVLETREIIKTKIIHD